MQSSNQNLPVPTSKESLTVYLPAEIKEALKQWSESEQRSMAFLAEEVITKAVNEWLEGQQGKKKSKRGE
jgi:predicted transcriptional regulator